MASTIKVDNVQNQPGTNIVNKCGTTVTVGAASDGIRSAGNNLQASDGGNLISQSGTDITLGASGDTINLASGASQTGFGRTGTVDWQTGSIKTAGFTPTNGEGYFCNTTGGIFTVTLPAGVAGNIVAFADYTRTFNTNNLTLTPNGAEKIGGVANDATLDVNGQSATFVYVDGTEGWVNVQETQTSVAGVPDFIAATGGSITCSGDYRIHTFTGPGTFEITKVASGPGGNPNSMDYLVGAGGGGGGSCCAGGGGGGGGYRESPGTATGSYSVSPRGVAPAVALTGSVGTYPITVGAGGSAGGDACTPSRPGTLAGQGANSIFSTITSTGGGLGASFPNNGGAGGSGGGASHAGPSTAGAGNTPPVTPDQGTAGVTNLVSADDMGGSGGGATVAAANTPTSRAGGTGGTTSITGSPVGYGGGGGGGIRNAPSPNADKNAFWPNASTCTSGASGGLGYCGGSSSPVPQATGVNGSPNKSGGGGASARTAGPTYHLGGVGGSGVVIIRYKFQ